MAQHRDAWFFEAADLTQDDIRDLTMKIRKRTLAEKRHGLMDSFDAEDMLQWEHDGGFSLDASVLIPDWDRAGLERLLRYCARPPVASTSVHLLEDNTVMCTQSLHLNRDSAAVSGPSTASFALI